MQVDPKKMLLHSLGKVARREHKKGNHSGAMGWTLIGLGILTLSVPIIGLPLIGIGIWQLSSSGH